ncbi:TKL protein kinase, variant [Aphanomyces invadans]|uniref:TKL protein kinase, variant n=1 Tax=Aphanomyces invadans TaxID=157072 RepID=A0A024UC25_9STRA|nr:TKL protein kinase, variant [Aphanomyces invadans]ETW03765.1 TKL protein kinase, variant [Aphanomyces invadans]|eukprot:XP_008867994.1 TKL protein kinase, variant [Aphanomyces invadans]
MSTRHFNNFTPRANSTFDRMIVLRVMRRLIVVAGVLSAPTAANDACVYSRLAPSWTNVLVCDQSLCPPANTTCIVDSATCRFLGTSDKVSWDSIGSFKDVPAKFSSWSFMGGRNVINLDMSGFPDRFTELKFTNVSLPTPSTMPPWPSHLLQLTMQSGNLKSISTLSPFPPSLQLLYLGANFLSSSDDLQAVPPSVTQLSLQNNDYTEIADQDWTRMSTVNLQDCGLLRSINMVQFSTAIVNLDLSYLTLTRWIMDNSTFKALTTSLRPNTTVQDAKRDDRRYLGYHYYGTSIRTDPTECRGLNGVIQELWADKALRDAKYAAEVYTVCVIQENSRATAPVSTLPPTPTPSSNQTAIIAGSVSSGVLALAIACFFVWRYYRRPDRPIHDDDAPSTTMSHPYSRSTDPPVYPRSSRASSSLKGASANSGLHVLVPIQLNESNLRLDKIVGSGAFANVWVGSYQGQAVAVKELLPGRVTSVQIQSFVAEIHLMSSFSSPFIVHVVGACWTKPSNLKCVMELMDGGDLKDYLEHHTPATFPWTRKVQHMYSIVQALVYLHSKNVIHRDIKSRNVLLDSQRGTKVTDFGTSKEDLQATMTVGVGTFRWMAPEVLQDKGYTISADMYSFGMILSEFDTHHIPTGTIRPTFTQDCPQWVHDLGLRCVAQDPNDRPTAIQASYEISKRLGA